LCVLCVCVLCMCAGVDKNNNSTIEFDEFEALLEMIEVCECVCMCVYVCML